MRKILFLLIILNVIMLTGCQEPKEGATPTHDFIINEYYQDNCIILHSQNFIISGESEPGVLLKAELYNDEDKKVESTSCIADIDGNFSLTLSAPKASFNAYELIIDDSVNKKTIKNIRFGEVWLFAGEMYDEYNHNHESNIDFDNVSFYTFNSGNYYWSDKVNESNNLFIEYYAKELSDEINMPVAVVDATLEKGMADAWLSYETANRYLRVKNYLSEIGRLIDTDENIVLDSNVLSSMYKTYLEPLQNINIRGIIWNQGKSQIQEEFKSISNEYSYLLTVLFSEFQLHFKNISIFSIHESLFGESSYNYLRLAQAIPTFQVKNVNLIPTYDCYKTTAEEVSFNNKVFNERVINSVVSEVYENNNEYSTGSYNNIVINANNYELNFEKDLLNVDELKGLLVCDSDNNPLEYDFVIKDNTLTIILKEEEAQAKYIYYGFNNDIYTNNLKTKAGIPIIPFYIELEVESIGK